MRITILKNRLTDNSITYDVMVSGENRNGDEQEIQLAAKNEASAWKVARGLETLIEDETLESLASIVEAWR